MADPAALPVVQTPSSILRGISSLSNAAYKITKNQDTEKAVKESYGSHEYFVVICVLIVV